MLYKFLLYTVLCGYIPSLVFAEQIYSQVDERLLLNPDPVQIKQEHLGKVIIYEKVRERTVDEALDNNFARIDNMMFVKTVIETGNGELEMEDDCGE